MMKDLEIAFTAKEITAFGGVSLLYKMLDNCHFKEALSSVGLPQQGSNRGKSPEQLIDGLFTGAQNEDFLSKLPNLRTIKEFRRILKNIKF